MSLTIIKFSEIMLNNFESNVKATIAFLKLLKVNVNNSTVDETLQNHPDWPSLLCISDSLKKWNIPNAAGKIESSDIDQLPTPFMAYMGGFENPLEIVAAVSDKNVSFYSKNYDKPITENKGTFLKRWKGIYLIAEKTENSGEQCYELNKKKAFIKRLVPISLLISLGIISILFLIRNLGLSQIINTFPIYLQYVILIIGICVTSMLLWHEIDNDNPILHKVCTGIIKGNCDAILSGKQSKLFSWLSWSEVGFFYFTGGLLTLLFVEPLPNSIAIISYMNLLALPYSVFSIYYQGRVAKQWCIFCLAVQILLVLGATNIILNGLLLPIHFISTVLLIKTLLFYFVSVSFWYTLKPYLLNLQIAKNTKREFLRIKFNTKIFETLLKKQKLISLNMEGIGIDFGNPSATNMLVKVCNPYCKPCSKAHPLIEKLIKEIPNLKVKIIFTTPNAPGSKQYKPVSHLLAINEKYTNEEIIKRALDDWYLDEKKDYICFAAKYPLNGELDKQGDKIEAMYNWCKKVDIKFTPTIFINGYQIPEFYNIDDLQYFLLE